MLGTQSLPYIDHEHVKNVEFVDGSRLAELVREHLPQVDAVQQLRSAHLLGNLRSELPYNYQDDEQRCTDFLIS